MGRWRHFIFVANDRTEPDGKATERGIFFFKIGAKIAEISHPIDLSIL